MTEQLEGQVSMFDAAGYAGKTSPALSPATKVLTSKPSLRQSAKSEKEGAFQYLTLHAESGNLMGSSWEMVGVLPGPSSTPVKWGEQAYRKEENASTLSQILDLSAPEKYSLSPKACAGILKRAEKRGKVLPDMLRDALLEVVNGFNG